MLPGALTEHLDVAQIVTAAFFLFFILLVIHLRREDRREGYPLQDPADRGRPDRTTTGPKVFALLNGGETVAPHYFPAPPMRAKPPLIATGNRLTPDGDPLVAAVGPGTYVMRSDQPFLDHEDEPALQPLRKATKWSVWPTDADPRGMTVVDAHREPVGLVTDLWVDREIKILRYMEVDLAATPGSVLLPIYAAEVRRKRREVMVPGLVAEQFVNVPRLADADRISAREEDQVNAYYAGGAFFNRESGALGRRRGRRTRR